MITVRQLHSAPRRLILYSVQSLEHVFLLALTWSNSIQSNRQRTRHKVHLTSQWTLSWCSRPEWRHLSAACAQPVSWFLLEEQEIQWKNRTDSSMSVNCSAVCAKPSCLEISSFPFKAVYCIQYAISGGHRSRRARPTRVLQLWLYGVYSLADEVPSFVQPPANHILNKAGLTERGGAYKTECIHDPYFFPHTYQPWMYST